MRRSPLSSRLTTEVRLSAMIDRTSPCALGRAAVTLAEGASLQPEASLVLRGGCPSAMTIEDKGREEPEARPAPRR